MEIEQLEIKEKEVLILISQRFIACLLIGVVLFLPFVSKASNLTIDPPIAQSITVSPEAIETDTLVNFTVLFNENANNVSIDDFTLTTDPNINAAIRTIDPLSGLGTSFVVSVGITSGTGEVVLSLNAGTDISDDVGNTGVLGLSSIPYFVQDILPPVVLAIELSGNPPTNATEISYLVTFNEPVIGVSSNDFDVVTISGTATEINGSKVITQVSRSTYLVTFGVTGTGDLRLDLLANTDISDDDINEGVLPFSSADRGVDRQAPIDFVTNDVNSRVGNEVNNFWNASNTNIEVRVPVANDVTLLNGTVQVIASVNNGPFENLGNANTIAIINIISPFTFSAADFEALNGGLVLGDEVSFNAIITDNANNSTTGTTSSTTITFDEEIPLITIDTPIAENDTINGAEDNSVIISGRTTGVEDGQGVTVTYTDGTRTLRRRANVLANRWEAPGLNISRFSNGIVNISADVEDLAGNPAVTANASVFLDNIAPTATVAIDDLLLITSESALVTIQFSEEVVGFDINDLTIPNGSLSILSTIDNITFTATFTPTANREASTNVIALNTAGVSDVSGNPGAEIAESPNFIIDTLRPTIVSTNPLDDAENVNITTDITIVFSENIVLGNGNITLVDLTDGSGNVAVDLTTAGGLTLVNNTLTIDLPVNLEAGTAYGVTIPSTTIFDINGNNFEGIDSADGNFNFTTAQPTIQFDLATSNGLESIPSADLNVSLSAVSSQTVIVGYSVTGTASQSTDFNLINGTIAINPGDLNSTIRIIDILDDEIVERNETIVVTIVSNTTTNSIIGNNSTHTYTIIDNDNASIVINDVERNEDNGGITVTATLNRAVQGGFSVNVSSVDGTATSGSDYNAISNQTLNFAGNAGEEQTFNIIPVADEIVETNETLTVNLSDLSISGLSLDISDNAIITILNDDQATVTVTDISGLEDSGNVTVSVVLSNGVQGGLSVDVSTADGAARVDNNDYLPVLNQTLVFTGNNGETVTFDIPIIADEIIESDENIVVNISSLLLNNSVIDANLITTNVAGSITITNDDTAAVTISDVSGAESGGAITVTAVLDNAVQGGFTVDVSTVDGTATLADNDYVQLTNQTLTFTGTAGETQTFTVLPIDDAILEADENLVIHLSNLSATTLPIDINDSGDLLILNDEERIEIQTEQTFVIDENSANGTFVGTVDISDVREGLSLNWNIVAGNSDINLNGIMPFSIDSNSGEIIVTDQGDLDFEIGSNTFLLTVTIDESEAVMGEGQITINLNDLNDERPIILPNQVFALAEGKERQATFGSVEANDPDVSPTTFADWVIVSGNEEGIFDINTNTGELSINENVTIDFESVSAYSLTITVSDGINQSIPESIEINVIDGNDAPLFDGLTNLEIDEDTEGILDFNIIDPDSAPDDIDIELALNNTDVISPEGVNLVKNGTNKIVTIRPLPNQFGEVFININVFDNDILVTERVRVIVNPVNDTPEDISLSNQLLNLSNPANEAIGFFTSVDIDLGDEHTYQLVLGEGSEDNELFAIEDDRLIVNEENTGLGKEINSIRVRSTDLAGEFIEEIFEIRIEGSLTDQFRINTAFSPNGDGINDTWTIKQLESLPNVRVGIFNREGKQVFESIGYEEPWDGTFRGKKLPVDTYYYVIDINDGEKLRGYVFILK